MWFRDCTWTVRTDRRLLTLQALLVIINGTTKLSTVTRSAAWFRGGSLALSTPFPERFMSWSRSRLIPGRQPGCARDVLEEALTASRQPNHPSGLQSQRAGLGSA